MKQIWIIMMGSLLCYCSGRVSRGAAKLPSGRSRLAHLLRQVIPPERQASNQKAAYRLDFSDYWGARSRHGLNPRASNLRKQQRIQTCSNCRSRMER